MEKEENVPFLCGLLVSFFFFSLHSRQTTKPKQKEFIIIYITKEQQTTKTGQQETSDGKEIYMCVVNDVSGGDVDVMSVCVSACECIPPW